MAVQELEDGYILCDICQSEIFISSSSFEEENGVELINVGPGDTCFMVPRQCPKCQKKGCSRCMLICNYCLSWDYMSYTAKEIVCYECVEDTLTLGCEIHSWYVCEKHKNKKSKCGVCRANRNYHLRMSDW